MTIIYGSPKDLQTIKLKSLYESDSIPNKNYIEYTPAFDPPCGVCMYINGVNTLEALMQVIERQTHYCNRELEYVISTTMEKEEVLKALDSIQGQQRSSKHKTPVAQPEFTQEGKTNSDPTIINRALLHKLQPNFENIRRHYDYADAIELLQRFKEYQRTIQGVIQDGKPVNKQDVDLKATSSVARPVHYGGDSNPHEPIKIIQHYELRFELGNAIKYILRAGKKSSETLADDLVKAIQYLKFALQHYTGEDQIPKEEWNDILMEASNQWKSEYDSCRNVLSLLVELKNHKDKNGKTASYETRKEIAWNDANEFLKSYTHF
jgi:Protein of unknwon function (DUF3310)